MAHHLGRESLQGAVCWRQDRAKGLAERPRLVVDGAQFICMRNGTAAEIPKACQGGGKTVVRVPRYGYGVGCSLGIGIRQCDSPGRALLIAIMDAQDQARKQDSCGFLLEYQGPIVKLDKQLRRQDGYAGENINPPIITCDNDVPCASCPICTCRSAAIPSPSLSDRSSVRAGPTCLSHPHMLCVRPMGMQPGTPQITPSTPRQQGGADIGFRARPRRRRREAGVSSAFRQSRQPFGHTQEPDSALSQLPVYRG
jgi:hypothetical protein